MILITKEVLFKLKNDPKFLKALEVSMISREHVTNGTNWLIDTDDIYQIVHIPLMEVVCVLAFIPFTHSNSKTVFYVTNYDVMVNGKTYPNMDGEVVRERTVFINTGKLDSIMCDLIGVEQNQGIPKGIRPILRKVVAESIEADFRLHLDSLIALWKNWPAGGPCSMRLEETFPEEVEIGIPVEIDTMAEFSF